MAEVYEAQGEESEAPFKPKEAIDLEKDIKEMEIKLRSVKARPFEIVEAEENTRATKLGREAKAKNELNA